MRINQLLKSTLDNYTYKRAIKKLRASRAEIKCDYCPYNQSENQQKHSKIKSRSWKHKTKLQKPWLK